MGAYAVSCKAASEWLPSWPILNHIHLTTVFGALGSSLRKPQKPWHTNCDSIDYLPLPVLTAHVFQHTGNQCQ